MCQLFALSANSPTAVTFSFTGFSARGGRTGEHVDGWGIAFHDHEGCRIFIDEERACESPLAEFLRQQPIRSRAVLAHIRKATQGKVQLSNCHPFVREWKGLHWTFCHNGDLKDFHPAPDNIYEPVGSTDSERAFCWILERLRARFGAGARPGWREIAPVLAELAGRVAGHGVFNFVLGNGEALFAYCSNNLSLLSRSHPFARVRLRDHDLAIDLGEANRPADRMVLVATEPLTHDEAWTPFAAGELKVLVEGAEVWNNREAFHAKAPSPSLRIAEVELY
jgi:glutamine amidotransferase